MFLNSMSSKLRTKSQSLAPRWRAASVHSGVLIREVRALALWSSACGAAFPLFQKLVSDSQ